MRGEPYMPMPIVYGPHLYLSSNAGVVTCHAAGTTRLLESFPHLVRH
jgi:hypothetical protein